MNKLTRIKKSLLAVSISIATSVVPSIQPVKADLFCYPWERGCKVDGKVDTSGNNIVGKARDGFIISVNNKTGTNISVDVTAYYTPKPSVSNNNCDFGCSSRWKTFGAWEFDSGEEALILNAGEKIIGRNATFKARSSDGRVWEREVDMGSKIGRFTFNFR